MNSRNINGCQVLVTRPAHLAADLVDALRGEGCRVTVFPVISVEAKPDSELRLQMQNIPDPDVIVFVSRNAVRFGLAATAGYRAKIAAIGPATAAELEQANRTADLVPEQGSDSESLLRHPALQDVAGQNVLIVRGQDGRDFLANQLRERGARVDYLAAYTRGTASHSETAIQALRERLSASFFDFVVVMSFESFVSLREILSDPDCELLRGSELVTPARRVIQTLHNFQPPMSGIFADDPRPRGIIDAIRAQPPRTSEL